MRPFFQYLPLFAIVCTGICHYTTLSSSLLLSSSVSQAPCNLPLLLKNRRCGIYYPMPSRRGPVMEESPKRARGPMPRTRRGVMRTAFPPSARFGIGPR